MSFAGIGGCLVVVAVLGVRFANCIILWMVLWVTEAWLVVTAKKFSRDRLWFCGGVNWVGMCIVVLGLGGSGVVGLVLFLILGGR